MPEPVWPRPRMSLPARASGMVAAWIGNGVVMPSRASRSTRRSGRPRPAKPLSASTVTGPSTVLRVAFTQVSASMRSASGSTWPSKRGAVAAVGAVEAARARRTVVAVEAAGRTVGRGRSCAPGARCGRSCGAGRSLLGRTVVRSSWARAVARGRTDAGAVTAVCRHGCSCATGRSSRVDSRRGATVLVTVEAARPGGRLRSKLRGGAVVTVDGTAVAAGRAVAAVVAARRAVVTVDAAGRRSSRS